MIVKTVVAAVLQDGDGRFLVTRAPKWNGYSFPMNGVAREEDAIAFEAIRAVEQDLGFSLGKATAVPLEYLVNAGVSDSSGKLTTYEFHLFDVRPETLPDLSRARPPSGQRPMFLTFDELVNCSDITWSATELVREFVEFEHAAWSVIARPGLRGTEVLLVWNDRYGGFFFPVQRTKERQAAEAAAKSTITQELGCKFGAPHEPGFQTNWLSELIDVHPSTRYDRERRYTFHVVQCLIPQETLFAPERELERQIARRGRQAKWVAVEQLAAPATRGTQTLQSLARSIASLLPDLQLPQDIRQRQVSSALIKRHASGGPVYLSRFDRDWKGQTLIGSSRRKGESPGDCMTRTLLHVFAIDHTDLEIGDATPTQVQFIAHSKTARELTLYTFTVFDVALSACALNAIPEGNGWRWASQNEIQRLQTHGGIPISPTMRMLLEEIHELALPDELEERRR